MGATYRGELVFTFLHDLGGEVMMREAARLLAAHPPSGERVETTKVAPNYLSLVRPIPVRYATRRIDTTHGPYDVVIEAHVYAIGAVGVRFRIPFEAPDLATLSAISHLRPKEGPNLEGISRQIADEIGRTVRGALVETYDADVDPETYLVIALTDTPVPARDIFEKEAQMLAGIVAAERRPERLSQEEVKDNLRTWFRYYEDDLVVVDWDRALVIEPSGKYDDVIAVMEAANLELLELRAYDRYLDTVLEGAYEDLTRFYGRGGLFRSARNVQAELSNARIDLVRVTDAINNIGKIFGDYYLAKLHLGLAERFHLKEWETIVREKMATLNELYTLASHEVEHRRGVVLELMIVLLFIVDLVLLFLVSGG